MAARWGQNAIFMTKFIKSDFLWILNLNIREQSTTKLVNLSQLNGDQVVVYFSAKKNPLDTGCTRILRKKTSYIRKYIYSYMFILVEACFPSSPLEVCLMFAVRLDRQQFEVRALKFITANGETSDWQWRKPRQCMNQPASLRQQTQPHTQSSTSNIKKNMKSFKTKQKSI